LEEKKKTTSKQMKKGRKNRGRRNQEREKAEQEGGLGNRRLKEKSGKINI